VGSRPSAGESGNGKTAGGEGEHRAVTVAVWVFTAYCLLPTAPQTISFSDFSGSALTTLRAGFALYCIGCLVKGLIPCLALVASLWTTLSLSKPGTTNTRGPFLPKCPLINSANPSNTLATCFFVRPLDSAIRA